MPQDIETYTHRIGRTGRVGQVGCALAYMGKRDLPLTDKIIEFLQLNSQEVPDFLRSKGGKGRPSGAGSGSGGSWVAKPGVISVGARSEPPRIGVRRSSRS